MNLLPQASGTRPRVACEISSQGVVAARSADAAAPLGAVARVELAAGAVVPGLRPGNVVDRVAVAAAVRKVLESVDAKPNSRDVDVTLVIPDSAVRVLLLDFDSLSNKLAEALPIVRFRLKKLLPFDADDAMVSYQVMSTSRNLVRVLAVAVPHDVLSEYETAVREAGFEPGAVVSSTLAALVSVDDESPALLVNANTLGVTTAIVQRGVLMLHRSVDLQEHEMHLAGVVSVPSLPLVDVDATQAEWAAQEALPEHRRDENEPAPLASDLQRVPLSAEIAQAVSVAAAYFEDTLAMSPSWVISAGPLGADKLGRILRDEGVGPENGLTVRELVESSALLSDAVTAAVPRAWLSGVTGALRG
jgi:type IV pilus assembly protein PilM